MNIFRPSVFAAAFLLGISVVLLVPATGYAASPIQMKVNISDASRSQVVLTGLSSEIANSLAQRDYKYTQNFVLISATGVRTGVIDMGGEVSGNTYTVDLVMQNRNPNAAVRTIAKGTYYVEGTITKMTLPTGSYSYTATPVATLTSNTFSWPAGSAATTTLPSCELVATPNYTTTEGDKISVAWTTQNATKAKWLKVTPKLKGAKFPSGKAKLSGSKSFTAIQGSPTLTLEVTGKSGKASCSADFTILGKASPRFKEGTIQTPGRDISNTQPTITGTAGLKDKTVYIAVMDAHAEKVLWKTKAIPVSNGTWSYTFEKSLSDGVYSLSLKDEKDEYMNMSTLIIRTK